MTVKDKERPKTECSVCGELVYSDVPWKWEGKPVHYNCYCRKTSTTLPRV